MGVFCADKFTPRSGESNEDAQLTDTTGGHSQTEPIHLLVALLREQEGTSRNLGTKAGVDADAMTGKAEATLSRLPTASGATVQQPGASAALTRVLAGAMDLATSMKAR